MVRWFRDKGGRAMPANLKRGDHVEWNSEAGWVRGTIQKKVSMPVSPSSRSSSRPPMSVSLPAPPSRRSLPLAPLPSTSPMSVSLPPRSDKTDGPVGTIFELAMPGPRRIMAEGFFVQLDAEAGLDWQRQVAV